MTTAPPVPPKSTATAPLMSPKSTAATASNSIVTKQEAEGLNDWANYLIRLAAAGPPQSDQPQYRNPNGSLNTTKFQEAVAAYNSNPVVGVLQGMWKQSLKDAGNPEDAKALYAAMFANFTKANAASINSGQMDPDAKQRQNDIMNSLWSRDWMGALQTMLRGIPVVGDVLATGKEMFRMVTHKEGFKPGVAWKHAKWRRALGGLLDNFGVTDPDQREAFVQAGVRDFEDPKHKERQPIIPSATASAKPLIPEGTVNPGTTVPGTGHTSTPAGTTVSPTLAAANPNPGTATLAPS